MIWLGASGKRYNYIAYISDVLAAAVRWAKDGAATATSPDFMIAEEDMQLIDFSIVTGLTDTTILKFQVNDVPQGNQILHANHLNTLATRPIPGMGVRQGKKFSFIQA